MIKKQLGFVLKYSGLLFLFREIVWKRKVTILLYHNPTPRSFENHIEFLRGEYNFISLDAFVRALYKKNWSEIPDYACVITFDDGHKRNYNLLNTIVKYNLRPTLYLCSDLIGSNRAFWWMTSYQNYRELKCLTDEQRLAFLKNDADYFPEKEYGERQALSLLEIGKLKEYINIGSHTKSHPVLINCSKEKSLREIEDSKKDLESFLKVPVKHFSYPNGDYGGRETAYAKKAGYLSARTCDLGWNDIHSDPFCLKIIPVHDGCSVQELPVYLTGMVSYLRYVKYGSFNGMHPCYL